MSVITGRQGSNAFYPISPASAVLSILLSARCLWKEGGQMLMSEEGGVITTHHTEYQSTWYQVGIIDRSSAMQQTAAAVLRLELLV